MEDQSLCRRLSLPLARVMGRRLRQGESTNHKSYLTSKHITKGLSCSHNNQSNTQLLSHSKAQSASINTYHKHTNFTLSLHTHSKLSTLLNRTCNSLETKHMSFMQALTSLLRDYCTTSLQACKLTPIKSWHNLKFKHSHTRRLIENERVFIIRDY